MRCVATGRSGHTRCLRDEPHLGQVYVSPLSPSEAVGDPGGSCAAWGSSPLYAGHPLPPVPAQGHLLPPHTGVLTSPSIHSRLLREHPEAAQSGLKGRGPRDRRQQRVRRGEGPKQGGPVHSSFQAWHPNKSTRTGEGRYHPGLREPEPRSRGQMCDKNREGGDPASPGKKN